MNPITTPTIPSPSSTTQPSNSFPFHFRGNPQHLKFFLDLHLSFTLSLSKSYFISLPLKPLLIQKDQFIQPIAQIQSIDQPSRENYLKNKSFIKQNISYVYFPSTIRVDQKIYKIYDKNYQNLVKQFPKSIRSTFSKLILWEQAPAELSIQIQKQKINQHTSNIVKSIVEKKLQTYMKEIYQLQNIEMTPKVLKSLFIVRSKIGSIFKQLKMYTHAVDNFGLLYQEVVNCFKKVYGANSSLNNVNSNNMNIAQQKTQYKSPFIIKNINTLVSIFQTSSIKPFYLQILTFIFLKIFQSLLQSPTHHYQSIKRFKQHLDFILSSVFHLISSKQQDISKNLFIIQSTNQIFTTLKSKPIPSIMNPQKQSEYHILNVSICNQYRNAIERVGVVLYGLNTYAVFPRNLEYEIGLCVKVMKNQWIDIYKADGQYKEIKVFKNASSGINVAVFLSTNTQSNQLNSLIPSITHNIFTSFQTYKHIYLSTLQLMQQTLLFSPYKKVSWSMKLSVLKSSIIFFTIQQPPLLSIIKLLQQDNFFSNFNHFTENSIWSQLQIINKLYKLTLCKRYAIKMAVQDLLSILLDKEIIELENQWKEIVKIVADIMWGYKDKDGDILELGKYGQGDDDNQENNSIVDQKKKKNNHMQGKEIN